MTAYPGNHLPGNNLNASSPTKLAEVAAEKQKLQTWAKLLASFRRHRNHHSPIYVMLSMKLECKGVLEFGVIKGSSSVFDVNGNYGASSEVSSTSDYKSGSDEDEEEEKDVKHPLIDHHFVAIQLTLGSSEKHFEFQPLFQGQSYLDVCKQAINFFAELDRLMLRLKKRKFFYL